MTERMVEPMPALEPGSTTPDSSSPERRRNSAAHPRGAVPAAPSAPSGDAEARKRRARSRWAAVGIIAACLLIWCARRPEQLLRPYVWAEEGEILLKYVEDGWWGALQPMVAGYEILPVNVLVPFAAWLSWEHLATLMYLLATGLFVATMCLIVLPESRWGGFGVRSAFALVLALTPVDPETFGVLLYGFWWISLWPMIILGWRGTRYRLRVPLLVLASLSSPAAGALFLVFGISWLRTRARRDLVSAAALLPGFLLQVVLVRTAPKQQQLARGGDLFDFAGGIASQVVRPVGIFATRWLFSAVIDPVFVAVVGLTILGLLLISAIRLLRRGIESVFLLWCVTVIYLALSAIAAPLLLDPNQIGRYVFLPYAALAWALICLAANTRVVPERVVAIGLVVASMLVLPTTFSRPPASTDGRLSWPEQIALCEQHDGNTPYPIPIYTDGSQSRVWSLPLTAEQCRDMARASLIGHSPK